MPNGTCRRDTRSGFTIIELLVVIGIIVILLGILLPVVNSVRKTAQKADSAAEITKIATSINNYYQDYRSYPGPVADSNIYGFNATPPTVTAPTITPAINGITQLSSTQNLVLGLLGGMSLDPSSTAAKPVYNYTVTLVNSGPQSLNVSSPQQMPPYFDAAPSDLANDGVGNYVSWTTANAKGTKATLSAIPELMDHFSNPHPIIYLRARLGSTGLVDNQTFPGGVNGGGTAAPTSQYYSMEMAPYWIGGSNAVPTVPTPGTPFPTQPDANNGNNQLYTTPQLFFNNASLNDGITPRNKDTFILISAGYDGIYGTSDDIVYPSN